MYPKSQSLWGCQTLHQFQRSFSGGNSPKPLRGGGHFIFCPFNSCGRCLSFPLSWVSSQVRILKLLLLFFSGRNRKIPISSLVFLVLSIVTSSSSPLELELLKLLQQSIRQSYFHLVINSLNSNITLSETLEKKCICRFE